MPLKKGNLHNVKKIMNTNCFNNFCIVYTKTHLLLPNPSMRRISTWKVFVNSFTYFSKKLFSFKRCLKFEKWKMNKVGNTPELFS